MTALVREEIWNPEGDRRRKPYEKKCGELGKSVNPKDCEVPPEERREKHGINSPSGPPEWTDADWFQTSGLLDFQNCERINLLSYPACDHWQHSNLSSIHYFLSYIGNAILKN